MAEYRAICCDTEDVVVRAEKLRRAVLPDVELATNGLASVERLLEAQKTLDVGCGRGAYAKAIIVLGYSGKLVGIDLFTYSGGTAYDEYEKLVFSGIESEEAGELLDQHEFDLVISIGSPPEVLKFIRSNREKIRLTVGGLLIIVTDNSVRAEDYSDFKIFKGNP